MAPAHLLVHGRECVEAAGLQQGLLVDTVAPHQALKGRLLVWKEMSSNAHQSGQARNLHSQQSAYNKYLALPCAESEGVWVPTMGCASAYHSKQLKNVGISAMCLNGQPRLMDTLPQWHA